MKLVSILMLVAAVAVLCGDAYAQCSMCRAALEASKEAADVARQLNLAVLILLVPPIAIFVGIFGIGYKHRNSWRDKREPD